MATKKQSLSDLQASIGAQLIEVNEIVKLCAFAAEARRILNGINIAIELDNDLDYELRNVDALNEWIEHEDNVGRVLKIVGHQIHAIIDQVEQQAGAHHAVQP